MTGIPNVRLELEAGEAVGHILVRLCEVAPDGRSRRVSWGERNLELDAREGERRIYAREWRDSVRYR